MPYLKIGVLASGGGSNFQAILDRIEEGGIDGEIALVISNNSGSGAIERARQAGLPWRHLSGKTHPDPGALDRAMRDAMIEAGVNLICLAGYMKKIGPETLKAFEGRILNIHPALLPRHGGEGCYGLRVHQKVLESGDTVSGATVHVVDGEYDHGPVLASAQAPVEPDDTPETLQKRVLSREHTLYPDTVAKIAAGAIKLPGL